MPAIQADKPTVPERQVIAPRPGEVYLVRFGSEVTWYFEHDVRSPDGKFLGSKPCYAEPCADGLCPYFGHPRYTRGYAACAAARFIKTGRTGNQEEGHWTAPRKAVLRFTPSVEENASELLGMIAKVWRERGDRYRSFRFEDLHQRDLTVDKRRVLRSLFPQTPEPFDIRPILCRFWREPYAFMTSAAKPQLRVVRAAQ